MFPALTLGERSDPACNFAGSKEGRKEGWKAWRGKARRGEARRGTKKRERGDRIDDAWRCACFSFDERESGTTN